MAPVKVSRTGTQYTTSLDDYSFIDVVCFFYWKHIPNEWRMSFNCRWTQETVQTTAARRYSWEIGGRRELGSFDEGWTETDRISRKESKVEGKINSNQGTDLKGLSITQRIMSTHIKDKNRDMKRLRDRKVTRLGAAQAVNCFSLNIWKLEQRRDFFP